MLADTGPHGFISFGLLDMSVGRTDEVAAFVAQKGGGCLKARYAVQILKICENN